MILHVLEYVFVTKLWHSDVNSSLIGWHKMSLTQESVICCHICCVYEVGMRIPFSKQYHYVADHLHLFFTNYYIFFHSHPLTAYYML